jgi:ABC-type molybdate transport system substrate-binding protein
VSWYITFAQSPLVIGYNPSSRFASELKTRPWYEVLEEPGIKIGRTDPRLDPKGALTVELLHRAEAIYKLPSLAQKVLGSPENPAQVHAEENLVDRLESGAIDVGFFYLTETTDQKVASMTLPADIALSAHYSVTVLCDAPHAAGAIAFVAFLLGPPGQAIMREHGLENGQAFGKRRYAEVTSADSKRCRRCKVSRLYSPPPTTARPAQGVAYSTTGALWNTANQLGPLLFVRAVGERDDP